MSSKEREGGEVAGVWANGEQLILQVEMIIMIMISMMANGKQLTLQLVDEAIFVTITFFTFNM